MRISMLKSIPPGDEEISPRNDPHVCHKLLYVCGHVTLFATSDYINPR